MSEHPIASLASEETSRSFTVSGTASHIEDTTSVVIPKSRFSRMIARITAAQRRGARRLSHSYGATTNWVAQHVTIPGYLALAVAILGVIFGLLFGVIEWLLPGLTALFLLLFASLFLFGGNNYDIDMGILDDHVVAGETIEGHLTITNTSRGPVLPGTIEIPVGDSLIDIAVPFLRPKSSAEQKIVIPGRRRGIIDIGPIRSIRSDPVGLLRRELHWTKKHTLYVHPRTVNLPVTARGFVRDLEGTPSRQLVTDDISFHAIREYMPGDSRRNIHWKTTAKTGKLMVRQFEETRKSMVGVLLTLAEAEYLNEEEFELAVSAAASLSVRFIRDHQEIDILVSEPPKPVSASLASAHRLAVHAPLACLNDFTAIDHNAYMMTLHEVATVCAHEIPDLSNIFLVTGSQTPLHSLHRTASLFPTDTAITIIRADMEVHPRLQYVNSMPVFTLGAIDDLRFLMSRMVQA